MDDLPGGPLHDRLADVIESRALLPVARLRSRVRTLRVLDEMQKTVVRLELEQAQALAPRHEAMALTPRVRLAGVLGYDKHLAAVHEALAGELGLLEDVPDLLDEAVLALGGDPRGIVTKVSVELSADFRADRAAIAVLVALAQVVQDNVPGAVEDLDPEFLHDLRVAVRRSRSVLRELRRTLPPMSWPAAARTCAGCRR